jgi:DNA polymerase-3 subunit delta
MKTEIYDELLPEEFRQLVGQDLNAAGLKIDKKAFDMLVSRLPISVGNWKQELEKLKLYPGKLDQAAVKALICKPLENDIFELSKAIVNHDVNRAMTIYQDLTIIAKTDPASLMGLVAYQFRFMCQVQNLAEHNYSISAIADQLGCKSYRVTMTLQSAVGMSTMDLLQILDRMAKLDKDIKTGNVDKQAGMELFILDMARRTPVWNH